MQESQQLQLGNPRDFLNLGDDEVRVCDTCGDVGVDYLVVCHNCHDGAEHTYCMHIKLQKIPEDANWTWTCQECMPREGTNQLVQDEVEQTTTRKKRCLSKCSTNCESGKGSKLKSMSSYTGENDGSSRTHVSVKRHQVPLETQSVEKDKAIETNVVTPKSFKRNNDPLVCKDFSCMEVRKPKTRSVNDIVYSIPQRSSDSQEKAMVPHSSNVRGPVNSLTKLNEEKKAHRRSVISTRTFNLSHHSLLIREPPFKKSGKAKLGNVGSISSLTQYSSGIKVKEVPNCLNDGLPKLNSQTEITHDSLMQSRPSRATNLKSKGQLEKASYLQKHNVERNTGFCYDKGKGPRTMSNLMSLNNIILEKLNDTCSNVILTGAYELHNLATCSLALDSSVTTENGGKETISGNGSLFSGPRNCNVDVVESFGHLDHRLQASNLDIDKDPIYPNEEKKNESQQDLTDLVQVETVDLPQHLNIPKANYKWQVQFQIHDSEGTKRTWDGIQALLSTCVSPDVIEVVKRLPNIIILEELPRLRIWPSQFMGIEVTEENIDLYLFACDLDSYKYYAQLMDIMFKNDLALKGNLDGVELLIFPYSVMPEKSPIWNQMILFWGIFKGKNVVDTASTLASNSLKLENGDVTKNWAFDLNAYPEDGDDVVEIDEISKFDKVSDVEPLGDKILAIVKSFNSEERERQEDSAIADADLSLWHGSVMPENDFVGIKDNNRVKKPSSSIVLAPNSSSSYEYNLDPSDWEAVDNLMCISRNKN